MQLKRIYFRRLNLNRLLRVQFIARHAYCIIKLAVKANRPHYFNEQKMMGKYTKNLCIEFNGVIFEY